MGLQNSLLYWSWVSASICSLTTGKPRLRITRFCASEITGPGEQGPTPATLLLRRGTEQGGRVLDLRLGTHGGWRMLSMGLVILLISSCLATEVGETAGGLGGASNNFSTELSR
ncbi:hypothetical protein BS78_10G227900 [Paspalum vaginatum]|nr:hypothetical protein BS78_10G227900 [Paspalum vaginatum]